MLPFNTIKRADNGGMAHMIMMGDSPQALALVANHTSGLPFLVRRQPRLRTKSHSTLLSGSSAAIRARQDLNPLVLGKSGEESKNALANRGSKVQPLSIESLEHRAPSRHPLDDPNAIYHRACCAIPLGEHKHIRRSERLDCSFKFGTPGAFSARPFLLKDALAARGIQDGELAVKVLVLG